MWECCEHLLAQLFIPGNVQLSLCEVLLTGIIADGDAEGKLAIFFVRYPYIDVADQFTHDIGGLLAVVPQLSAVVVIAGDGYAPCLGLADGPEGKIGCALTQRWRDSADVEPVRSVEDGFPVEGGRPGLHHA